MKTDNIGFHLQNRLFLINKTGQRYSDTFPFSTPWPYKMMCVNPLMRLCHPPDGSTSPKYKLLCFITTKIFCKEKNALALALHSNIRLGWKGLPGTNTLANYKHYGRIKFYNIGPWLEH
jgi:hypothetical protein